MASPHQDAQHAAGGDTHKLHAQVCAPLRMQHGKIAGPQMSAPAHFTQRSSTGSSSWLSCSTLGGRANPASLRTGRTGHTYETGETRRLNGCVCMQHDGGSWVAHCCRETWRNMARRLQAAGTEKRGTLCCKLHAGCAPAAVSNDTEAECVAGAAYDTVCAWQPLPRQPLLRLRRHSLGVSEQQHAIGRDALRTSKGAW